MSGTGLSIRRLVRTRRRILSDDAGLGMTEVIVAIMVFAIIATTAAYGMINALTLTQQSRASETALSIASSDLDQMRLTASANNNGVFAIQNTTTPIPKSVGGTNFSITRAVSWQTTNGSVGACGTGSGTLQYKNVTETVSWRATNGVTRSVTMSSAVAPLSNINSDATGTIIVTVTGANSGNPIQGATVSITPVSGGGGAALTTAPQVTDQNGCSFGLLVQPGTYKVTASLGGYIDPTQSSIALTAGTPPQAVSVVAGQNQPVSLSYDQAAAFPLTYPAGVTLPTNLPISFVHGTTTSAFNTTALPPVTATPPASVQAYPWVDGYTILAGNYVYTLAASAGSCLDTNPAAWTTPRADGAVGTAPAPVAVGAGGTAASYAVPMGTFTLNSVSSLKGKYITAVSTTPASGSGDPGCNAGQTITFGTVPNGTSSMTLALPYGTWRLYAGSAPGSTTTSLPNSGNGTIGTLIGGLLGSLSGGAQSIMLDPRAVVTP